MCIHIHRHVCWSFYIFPRNTFHVFSKMHLRILFIGLPKECVTPKKLRAPAEVWMFVWPSKFLCWSPKPQCDSILRYSLWEAARFRGDIKSNPMMELMHLQEEEVGSLSLPVRKQQADTWLSASQEVTPTRHLVCKHLDFSLLSSRTMRNCLFVFLAIEPMVSCRSSERDSPLYQELVKLELLSQCPLGEISHIQFSQKFS